ncbi:hypothetical protein GQ57_19200 [Burkholderia sp. MSh2]|uniref:hypothetical protein n=1 Tax=Burkholderia TaxID=32008 RepID=UPI0004D53010|nr:MULTISPECIES: hypothetical protein [Burkholderia]KEZ04310.1 hypothetical protein GQ57_19200 [Burkholderia sp. MSh2]
MIIIIITVFQSGVYEIQASARRVNRPDRPLARNPDDSPKSGACVLSYPADSGAWRHRPSSDIRQGTPISVMTPPGGAGERIAGQTPHQRPHDREHRDGTDGADAVRNVLNDIELAQVILTVPVAILGQWKRSGLSRPWINCCPGKGVRRD